MSAPESSPSCKFQTIPETQRSAEIGLGMESKSNNAKRCALSSRSARMVEVTTLTLVIVCAIVLLSLPSVLHFVKKVSFYAWPKIKPMHEYDVRSYETTCTRCKATSLYSNMYIRMTILVSMCSVIDVYAMKMVCISVIDCIRYENCLYFDYIVCILAIHIYVYVCMYMYVYIFNVKWTNLQTFI